MKLSTKIAASMGCLAVLMAIMGGYLIMQTAKINDSYSMIVEQMMPIRSNAGSCRQPRLSTRVSMAGCVKSRSRVGCSRRGSVSMIASVSLGAAQQAQAVEDHQQTGPHVGEDGHPHGGIVEDGQK